MKLFLDTADVGALQRWIPTGIIDGVTTNPTLLSKATSDPLETIQVISGLLPHGDVSVEVTEEDMTSIYEQAHRIARLANNIVVKIPCHIKYYPIMERLVKEGVKVNVTLVFTLFQGLAMTKLGVRYISPFIGRLEDVETDGMGLIRQLRSMLDMYGNETELLAASLRSVQHLHEVIEIGVDAATVPVSILEKAVNHPLTDEGMKRFIHDWKQLGIKQFP
ncbi:fructose-6-phosphate aldolase [Candidatus Babeliales bacterium]|nr:fructose-6-phosphate aldolase [Candidatus Babeliales bacterium]